MADRRRDNRNRRGSVYLAVLGTGLIVSLLALSALALQRLQNRMLTASADVRQAELNAEAAVELGLLAIKQDSSWRTTYANGTWFSNRGTSAGTCTLTVTDPIDANLADDDSEAIVMTGIGSAGKAVQRVVRTVDSNIQPLACLRSSVAAGGAISLTGCVLRATNSGLISANSSAASSSTVYGKVQAVTVSGATYSGTTTQIAAADRPAMPNWSTVFNYYRTNGTEININSLPNRTLNLGQNPGVSNAIQSTDWDVTQSYYPAPTSVSRQLNIGGHSDCLRVQRGDRRAGAMNNLDIATMKPSTSYHIDILVRTLLLTNVFKINLVVVSSSGTVLLPVAGSGTTSVTTLEGWKALSATLTTPAWSGTPQQVIIVVNSDDPSGNSGDFYVDSLDVYESTTNRYIYKTVLGPGVNPFGATTNSQGIYWINCGGAKLVIERARIRGTLVVVNPGSGSCVNSGPINWSPAVPGYPALLVDADTASNADFTIAATNESLNEAENGVNYNPSGANHDSFGQDSDMNDVYPSEIQGLVVVEDDLTFQNNALVRGEVIAGDAITATSGTLEVVFRPDALFSPPPGFTATPSQVGRPVSIRKAVLP